MKIVNVKLEELKPYEKNPRYNDDAVEYVANSIKEFGFKVPIVVDKNNVIVAGHTRYKASKELNLKEVPCIVADDLTDEQIKAYRLADNKVSEQASWNYDLLDLELDDIINIDMGDFGFNFNVEEMGIDLEEQENPYTTKINIPQYEIKGDLPEIEQLYDNNKYQELMENIERAHITDEQKDFLRKAATRHLGFNYSKIAEYYAHQDKEMQELMEQSALVIIDFDDAIKNGYIEFKKGLEEISSDVEE